MSFVRFLNQITSQVYRVRHKLDGTEYAVKKIPIRSEGIESVKNYLSEVKTFASLNHSNIVQYKAAWLELGAPKTNKAITHDFSDSEEESSNSDDKIDLSSLRKQTNSDFEVSFENSTAVIQRHYPHSNADIFASDDCKFVRQKRNSISEGANAVCTLDFHNLHVQAREHPKWATLYIQMALCQSTLKQWLEKRNLGDGQSESALVPVKGQVRNDTIMEILRQLLKGNYMIFLYNSQG